MEQLPAERSARIQAFTRVSKACRRCRRLRTKCINQGGVAPCESCRLANEQCHFPKRGEPGTDRAFRQARSRLRSSDTRASITSGRESDRDADTVPELGDAPADRALSSSLVPSSVTQSSPKPGWESLPPFEEVFEGIQCLTTSYFQLGFLPKSLYFDELRRHPESVNFFLLFSILSVSARFTPSLVKRYQGGTNATQVFLRRASGLVADQMFTPTLESIQGFFLMSIAEWGNGDKNRSLVYIGIAIRLAGILRMHREETYRLPDNATNEDIVYSEVSRRTFWMLETFENLHSGSDSPVAFSYNDITALLPCDEREFTFGIQPMQRAALIGTPPAMENPELTRLPSRSLFATLLQTHNLWGQVARLVSADGMQISSGTESRINAADYERLSQALVDFESQVPQQHSWSVWNMRAFKTEGLDLAFLSAVMVLRLSNIILRRSYLHDILNSRRQSMPSDEPDRTDPWPAVADQLFNNMLMLHEQVSAFFEYRSPEHGYPALIVFCVYVCGSLANHLQRQPQICARVAPRALQILQKSIRGLGDLQGAWPFARRWYFALHSASDKAPQDSQDAGDTRDVSMASVGTADTQMTVDLDGTQGFEVQFNDPIPTDSMYGAFERCLWDDIFNAAEWATFEEPLAVAAWTST